MPSWCAYCIQSYSPASELSLLSSSSVRKKMGFFIFSSSAASFAFRLLKLLAMANLAFACRTFTVKKKVSTGTQGWLMMTWLPCQAEGSEGLNIKLNHWSFPHKSDINRERIEGLSPVVLSAVRYLLVWSVVVYLALMSYNRQPECGNVLDNYGTRSCGLESRRRKHGQ